MKRVVVFNVCGTRYESSVSVIESKPHSMLAMLLKHHNQEKEEEIFVQRDPFMFRWILYYYTTDIIVDEDTVCVSKEVWDREIDFYALLAKEGDSLKRPLEVDHELESLAKKHVIETNEVEEARIAERVVTYKKILEYVIPRLIQTKGVQTCVEFVGRSHLQSGFDYPYNYPSSLQNIDFEVVNDHFSEFIEYAAKLGFFLVLISYDRSCRSSRNPYSIVKHDIRKTHQSFCIGLRIKD